MAEPEAIVEAIIQQFDKRKDLAGKRVLITAGATREAVDPVRFFTNRSTGKMGYALAEAAQDRGAQVTLISGSFNPLAKPPGVEWIPIESAEDMYQAVMSKADDADIIIKSAAVADYRPAVIHDQKMKKIEGNLTIALVRTKDILRHLGENKQAHQVLVGFAAETENVEENAMKKVHGKNLDFIVANNVAQEGAGFGTDTNIVSLYDRNGLLLSLPQLSKREVSDRILDEAILRFEGKTSCMHKS